MLAEPAWEAPEEIAAGEINQQALQAEAVAPPVNPGSSTAQPPPGEASSVSEADPVSPNPRPRSRARQGRPLRGTPQEQMIGQKTY